MGKEPFKPAIDKYLETFSEALEVIYQQIDDDKQYMDLVTRCRKVSDPLPQPHQIEEAKKPVVEEEEEKKSPLKADLNKATHQNLLDPLLKLQALFDEHIELQKSAMKILD